MFVAGAIGPLGKPVAPLGTIPREEALFAYREQAEGLVEGGVDLLIIETQTDLSEALLAVDAVRAVTSDLPLVVEMTYTEDGGTRWTKPSEINIRVFGASIALRFVSRSTRPVMVVFACSSASRAI